MIAAREPVQGVSKANLPSHSASYRSDIEGLRGIAVLLVVIFHCGIPKLSGGFIGVDVFFVLSGYLITGLLVSEIQKTSKVRLLEFYARRARRLLPASALTLLVVLLTGAIILAPHELAFAGRAARGSAVYLSNMFFAMNAADYFAPDVATNPFLHTWSLAVEEQFYLFWPLVIMLGLQFWRSTRALYILLWCLTGLSLVASVWLTENSVTYAFYGLPARAWEFGIGGLAVLAPRGAVRISPSTWLGLGWAGLFVIVISAFIISPGAGFPGWWALIPTLGTIAVLMAGAEQPHRGAGALLDFGMFQVLGKHSYSWYLWHWPFLVFAAALLPNIGLVGKIAAATLSLVVALITHRLVENPIRFHPYLMRRPAVTLILALVVTVSSVAASFAAIRWANHLAQAPAMEKINAAVLDIADMPRDTCVTLGDSAEVKTCEFGQPSGDVHLALFGDSHAMQWFNAIRRIAETRGWRLTTFLKSGCPAYDADLPKMTDRYKEACSAWRNEAIRKMGALHPTIVMAGSATLHISREESGGYSSESLGKWQNAARRTLSSLSEARLRTIALRDTPLSPFDVPTCLARSARHSWYPGGACEILKSASVAPEIYEVEKAAAKGLVGTDFLDMTDQLCEGAFCRSVQKELIVYRDNNHLTGKFAESLAQVVETRLLTIMKDDLKQRK